jgi:hypothetical protein
MRRVAVAVFILVGVVAAAGARAIAAHPLPPRTFVAPRPAPPPEPLVLPGQAGCTLRATKRSEAVTLELAPGVAFARVAQAESIEVTLPIGSDTPAAGVAVTVGNVKLKGLAGPSGLSIYPARPLIIGEMLVLGPQSRLRWVEVAADRVVVEPTLGKESRTEVRDVKVPLRATRSCADLRLTSRGFDSYDAVGGRGFDLAAGLRASASVPISAQPNGPTMAKLVVSRKASDNEVTVLDEDKAGWSRIARPAAGDLLVVGWVKQAQLGKPPARDTTYAAFNAGGLKPTGLGADAGAAPSPVFACPKEIALVAEAAGLRRIVGGISQGVRMRTAPADADFVRVEFAAGAASTVTPADGARLLVRRADVERCPGYMK